MEWIERQKRVFLLHADQRVLAEPGQRFFNTLTRKQLRRGVHSVNHLEACLKD